MSRQFTGIILTLVALAIISAIAAIISTSHGVGVRKEECLRAGGIFIVGEHCISRSVVIPLNE